MDLRLTEEHKMIRKMTRQFAEKEVAPIAAEMDEKGEVPFENIKKMGKLGLLGLTVSEEHGGAGMDTVSYCLAVEEISKACAATAIAMAVHNSLVCYGIERFATEDQKQRFLAPLVEGRLIGAFALTEPEAGSDAAVQETTMVLNGDEYLVNGTKNMISNGGFADIIVLFCMTDKSQGHRGITALLVEKGTPGFSAGPEEDKLGIRASSTCELIFEDCRVPVANRLGAEGQGFKVAMASLDAGRIVAFEDTITQKVNKTSSEGEVWRRSGETVSFEEDMDLYLTFGPPGMDVQSIIAGVVGGAATTGGGVGGGMPGAGMMGPGVPGGMPGMGGAGMALPGPGGPMMPGGS